MLRCNQAGLFAFVYIIITKQQQQQQQQQQHNLHYVQTNILYEINCYLTMWLQHVNIFWMIQQYYGTICTEALSNGKALKMSVIQHFASSNGKLFKQTKNSYFWSIFTSVIFNYNELSSLQELKQINLSVRTKLLYFLSRHSLLKTSTQFKLLKHILYEDLLEGR